MRINNTNNIANIFSSIKQRYIRCSISIMLLIAFLWPNILLAHPELKYSNLYPASCVTALIPIADAYTAGQAAVRRLSKNKGDALEAFRKGRVAELSGIPCLVFPEQGDLSKLAYYVFNPNEPYFSRMTTYPEVNDSLWGFLKHFRIDKRAFPGTRKFKEGGQKYYQQVFVLNDGEVAFINLCLREIYHGWGIKGIKREKSDTGNSIRGPPILSASLLAVEDPVKYSKQSMLAIKAGADMIHFDVVGGRGKETAVIEKGSVDTTLVLTPNAIREIKNTAEREGLIVPVDVHMMDMEPSEEQIARFIDAGADIVTVHWEAFSDKDILKKRLQYIKDRGAKAGIAFRPDVKIEEVGEFIVQNPELISLVSQAGVYPCFGGQVFIYDLLKNIEYLYNLRKELNLHYQIMVDGGIEPEVSGRKCVWAGADVIVAGSAFFGNGERDLQTLKAGAEGLKDVSPIKELDVYDAIAYRIQDMRKSKKGKVWVRIDAYHGAGKTYTAEELKKRLLRLGLSPVVVGLDISWSDRVKREGWKKEAYDAMAKGEGHNYFHSLQQGQEPMHWRKWHSDYVIKTLESGNGDILIRDCYQFNSTGDIMGEVTYRVTDDSIILVEGVYVSALENENWDLCIYVDTDKEIAKKRAMARDEKRVFRQQADTRALYEDVYEPTYKEYVDRYDPANNCDILLDAHTADENLLSLNPRIVGSSTPLIILECTNLKCRKQYPSVRINTCTSCGKDLANKIIGEVDFEGMIDPSMPGMWRYHRLMPIRPENIITDGEGNTPVVHLDELSRRLGVELYVKLETVNPTGTFKDREGSYVIGVSRQEGQDNVVMQSTGNTAMAITHYARLAGMNSWVFIPCLSGYKLWMPPKHSRNRIIAVNGHPIDVKNLASDFALRHGFPKISPFYERCEANATQGYEIAEGILGGKLPNFDFYVQTVAAGMGPIGFFIGMKRVNGWTGGKIAIPRIVGVEINEFAPIQEAWDLDLEEVGDEVATPRFPEHSLFEPTLWTTNIKAYYPHLRRILKESRGILTKVTPGEVQACLREYGIDKILKSLGYSLLDTENATFVSFAGLVQQIKEGGIPKGSKVILMLTGKGSKSGFVKEVPDITVSPGVNIGEPQYLLDDYKLPLRLAVAQGIGKEEHVSSFGLNEMEKINEADRYGNMLSDAIKMVVQEYKGQGILMVTDQIEVVRNLRASMYRQGRAPLAVYVVENGVRKIKVDEKAFSDIRLLYEEIEHEFSESIARIVPGSNPGVSDVLATVNSVRNFLKSPADEQDRFLGILAGDTSLDPDKEYQALLRRLQGIKGRSDDEVIASVVRYVLRTKLYEDMHDELGLPNDLAGKVRDLEPRMDDALAVFNEIKRAKEGRELVEQVKEREGLGINVVKTFSDVRIRGLERLSDRLARIISALVKAASKRDRLALELQGVKTDGRYCIILDRQRETRETKEELKVLQGYKNSAGEQLFEVVYSLQDATAKGYRGRNIIHLVDPGDIMDEGDILYLPMPYLRSSLYMAAIVVTAGGDINAVNKLVMGLLFDLYPGLAELTPAEQAMLFTQPWSRVILSSIQSVIAEMNSIRMALETIEEAA